jgi:hypothetical protein
LYNAAENVTIISDPFVLSIQTYNHATDTLSDVTLDYGMSNMTYYDGKVYGILYSATNYLVGYVDAGSAAVVSGSFTGRITNSYNSLVYNATANTFYGLLDMGQVLYMYNTTPAMFIDASLDFEGTSITDQIKEILASFNLIATISADKVAHIYRRSDNDGVPVTSGNTLSLTLNGVEDITEEVNYIQPATFVTFSNGTITWSYNGTRFNSGVTGDGSKVSITNKYCPNSLVKDFAYSMYQFFKSAHTLYTILLANVALFQYECFDKLSVTFAGNKIVKTGEGPIYGVVLMSEGSMQIQVLI